MVQRLASGHASRRSATRRRDSRRTIRPHSPKSKTGPRKLWPKVPAASERPSNCWGLPFRPARSHGALRLSVTLPAPFLISVALRPRHSLKPRRPAPRSAGSMRPGPVKILSRALSRRWRRRSRLNAGAGRRGACSGRHALRSGRAVDAGPQGYCASGLWRRFRAGPRHRPCRASAPIGRH